VGTVLNRDFYQESTPVRGSSFFGRKSLLKTLHHDLSTRGAAGIFGLRKVGKTSLLRQLSDELSHTDTGRWIITFMNLESLAFGRDDSPSELLHLLTHSIAAVLRREGFASADFQELESISTVEELESGLRPILRTIRTDGARLGIAFDEVDYLAPYDQDANREADKSGLLRLFSTLHSLAQDSNELAIVVSGIYSGIVENSQLHGDANPLFSWARPHFLSGLIRLESDALVRTLGERMQIEWTSNALSQLFEETDGHPWLLRSLASQVVQEIPFDSHRRVSASLVTEVTGRWRVSVSGIALQSLRSLDSFYPKEGYLLDLVLRKDPGLKAAIRSSPSAADRLVKLGLAREEDGRLILGALARLAVGGRKG
jgi:hypothetical protein